MTFWDMPEALPSCQKVILNIPESLPSRKMTLRDIPEALPSRKMTLRDIPEALPSRKMTFRDVFRSLYLQGNMSGADRTLLFVLANKCPAKDGAVVYQARSLR